MPRVKKVEATPDIANMAPVSLRFTQPQMKRLTSESYKTGLPMTEIVRRAVDAYLADRRAAA